MPWERYAPLKASYDRACAKYANAWKAKEKSRLQAVVDHAKRHLDESVAQRQKQWDDLQDAPIPLQAIMDAYSNRDRTKGVIEVDLTPYYMGNAGRQS